MKQQKLFPGKNQKYQPNPHVEFGGSLLKGKRKKQRPLSFKWPTHLVLKATNSFVLLKNKSQIEGLLESHCKKMGVKLFNSGVHADHVHLFLLFPNRKTYTSWIRGLTSILVQRFAGLKWRLRPYTKIIRWGNHFRVLKNYILKNKLEGEMIIEFFERVKGFRRVILLASEHLSV